MKKESASSVFVFSPIDAEDTGRPEAELFLFHMSITKVDFPHHFQI